MSTATPAAKLAAAICAFLTLPLSGCATFVRASAPPELPAHLSSCPDRELYDLPDGPLSRADAAETISGLMLSEDEFRRCAGDLRAFYEALRTTRNSRANQP